MVIDEFYGIIVFRIASGASVSRVLEVGIRAIAMNAVFLSYDSKDRAVAQRLADALEGLGWSVWWDREIPFGKAFDLVIEQQLNAARFVIEV